VKARERRRVGRYEIVRVIGRGGTATVYLARQRDLARDVALKELAPFGDPGAARRFLREARLAASLSHPNIVVVHDYFEQNGVPYIAMEYLPRGSLRPYVGRLTLSQVGGVLLGVLGGLAHAEQAGIVHRDLKPENIMVTADGGVKIADFGIAKALTATHGTTELTTAGTTLGTPRYMSPERAMGQPLGPWTDLYSVGAIAFELLIGHAPFAETQEPMAILMRQINDPIPPVKILVPDVDERLSAWIEHLLAKEPRERTQSAAPAAEALDEIICDILGDRWQRSAALPEQPGAPTAPTLPYPRSPTAAPRTIQAPRRPTPPPAVPEATDARLTVAPQTLRAPRRRRPPRVWAVALCAAAIVAIGVALVRPGGPPAGGSLQQLRDRAASHRAEVDGATSDSARERGALRLADDYAQAVRRVKALAPSAANLRRAATLQRIAQAYRDAADAARREDGSDYDDAMATAAAGEAALKRGGPGDSRSDDPSDDEPDENDNGD
jgi:hypothetical protein